jgi:hypothetical protein
MSVLARVVAARWSEFAALALDLGEPTWWPSALARRRPAGVVATSTKTVPAEP